MISTYKVELDQNLFDVAIKLFGSVEGIFDLLISNPTLSVNDELAVGQELKYHDFFIINQGVVDFYQDKSPANLAHKIYPKEPQSECAMMVIVPSHISNGGFTISGEGAMVVDWGDNSPLETIDLSNQKQHILHYYDNVLRTENRIVRIYGEFSVREWDITQLYGEFFPTKELHVDEITYNGYRGALEGIRLFDTINVVVLQDGNHTSLAPLQDASLQILDLSHSIIPPKEFERFVQYITKNYGLRRNCEVTAHVELTVEALDAIELIVTNPEWNENGQWVFNINGIRYDNNYDWGSDVFRLNKSRLNVSRLN